MSNLYVLQYLLKFGFNIVFDDIGNGCWAENQANQIIQKSQVKAIQKVHWSSVCMDTKN